jgi:prephenate dehydratase
LIPENGSAFVAAAKQVKLRPKKSTAFHLQGEDHPGAVADVLKKLADAKISMGALQAVCGSTGRYGAVVFLSPAATKKAAAILGAA